jgi:hypothetical protein
MVKVKKFLYRSGQTLTVPGGFKTISTGGVVAIFHRHNLSSCTMALWSTQPLREMSTRDISWGIKAAGA